jgi:PQQ-like domain
LKKINDKRILSLAIITFFILSGILVASNINAGNATITAPVTTFPTWTFISVTPLVDGMGQPALIAFWQNFIPETAQGMFGDRWTFTLNVVKPDGTNDTLGPFESDPVGDGYTAYTPTEVGQYQFQAFFLKHVIDGGANRGLKSPQGAVNWPGVVNPNLSAIGNVFLPSMSQPQNMTVQQDPVPTYKETPLPTDYWSRPVYDAVRTWGPVIMGEWYGAGELGQFGNGGRYNPFSTGPASAHILWTKPFWDGGVAGGAAGLSQSGIADSYYSGQSYESYGGPSIILNGKVYYSVATNPREGYYIVDLATGKTDYYQNNTGGVGTPAFGQVLCYDTGNQHGQLAYYWVTSTGKTGQWDMYDDFSNNYICSIVNTTWTVRTPDGRTVTEGATGTTSYGLDGSILRYNIVNLGTTASPSYYLQVWNSTMDILAPSYIADIGYVPVTGVVPTVAGNPSGSNVYWEWRPTLGTLFNGTLGFSANISIANNLPYTYNYSTYSTSSSTGQAIASSSSLRQIIPDDKIIGIDPGSNNGTTIVQGTVWALNLNSSKGTIGSTLYSYKFNPPAGLGDAADQPQQFSQHDTIYSGINAAANIFWYQNSMNRVWFVYSLTDGRLLWTSPQGPQFEEQGMGSQVVYNNEFIDCGGYGGVVAAYDAQTGAELWNWTAPLVGQGETPYQNTPISYGCLSGDGQLYLYSNEHSVNNPIRRDAMIWDLNASTGQEIWQETCWPSAAPILGDGDLLVLDDHDNQIYNYGKGPSATTVQTPLSGIIQGQSFIIQGTVKDTSPGTTQTSISLRFPNGVPAVSDASENAWMEYVYHQAAKPTNTEGVSVEITAIDPNGNFQDFGKATSDDSGTFVFTVNPNMIPVPGTYQIIANFAGTNSNYPSYAEAGFVVNSESAIAPTATPLSLNAVTSSFMSYLAVGVIAIIIAIAIVGVLILRKHS